MYDSLRKGKGRGEVAKTMLVEFGRKAGSSDDSDSDGGGDYPAQDEGEEWVEYTDALGRTRTCMKKDLPKLKEQDKEYEDDRDYQDKQEEKKNQEEFDLLSASSGAAEPVVGLSRPGHHVGGPRHRQGGQGGKELEGRFWLGQSG